jgi:hypothetical protein
MRIPLFINRLPIGSSAAQKLTGAYYLGGTAFLHFTASRCGSATG